MYACVDSFLLQIFHTNGSILNAFSSALFFNLRLYWGSFHINTQRSIFFCVYMCGGKAKNYSLFTVIFLTASAQGLAHGRSFI